MSTKKKLRNISLTIAGIIVIFIIVVIAFISPIAKYFIEKNSVKYLGRQIKMSWMYLNPFTGYVHFSNLKIYEYQSDTLFLQADGLSARYALLKTFSKTYEISSITLDKPVIEFVQHGNVLNLDDVIKRFSPKGPPDTTKGPTHFNLLNMKINDGEIHYIQPGIPINYFIKKLNLKSEGLRWNSDTIAGHLSFDDGPASGHIKADFALNIKSLGYRIAAVVDKYDLGIINQYLQEMVNYGRVTANLDADINASGSLIDQLDLDASGYVAVNDMHFGKVPGEDYASFKKVAINMLELSPKNQRYYFDTIMVDAPFFKYERYDHLDNLQQMFGKNGENISAAKANTQRFNLIIQIADYIKVLAENFIQSYYKINRVAIYDGDMKFADYSLREKFSVAACPLNLLTDTIDKNKERMNIHLKTALQPFGLFAVNLSLDPNDYGYFDLDYHLKHIPLSMFNPYVTSYTSFPLDRGSLEFNGTMVVEDSSINCNNHLLILDPRTGKRLVKKDTRWIPMPLILSIVRERSAAIDYEIPIKGRLSDPKFKLWNVIGHIVENIFVKPPSTPYLFHVKELENKVEKSLVVKWETRADNLRPNQEKFINKVADFLKSTPDASISVAQLEYAEKEKEYILFFEAKKKYFLHQKGQTALTETDSIMLDKMSVKDSGFVKFLDRLTKDTLLFTIQEKCGFYLGKSVVEAKYAALLAARKSLFLNTFKDNGHVQKIHFLPTETTIPFNGFSYYEINYKGEFPENLLRAYEKMDELDVENPRGKYEVEREKNGGIIPETKEVRHPKAKKGM